VASTKRDVDPIGACVGLRGTRIQVISRELRGEKIDIVEWSPDAATFVSRALSPAKVSSVTLGEPETEGAQRSVLVIVPDSQLSLAIGKRGQNARLAAKLTGLRVDIKSAGEVEEERRREEEELIEGRAVLAQFPGVDPQLIEKLVELGLYSPARIARAGVTGLQEIPGVGEKKALGLFEAAQGWVVAEHAAALAAKEEAENADPGAGAEVRDAPGGDEVSGEDLPPNAQQVPAE
jgi:N utilization substance protein A